MIKRQNQPWTLTARPTIEWRGDTPYSADYADIYFSPEDGIEESRYVFLEGAGTENRIVETRPGEPLVVTEIGFGSGLNFLLTLKSWTENRLPNARLHYIGIDHLPLLKRDLKRILAVHPEVAELATALLSNWPAPTYGCHRIHWAQWNVTLDLWWEDAAEVLADLASHHRQWINLWYLDGFAPARNTTIWSDDVFRFMGLLSKPQARFATFTAAGSVRRNLMNQGFQISKRPGFGRKRECMSGQSIGGPNKGHWPDITPWDTGYGGAPPKTALVLGAGLAGCTVARSLADRGVAVTVLDRGPAASGGSSNLQGLTYTRLSRKFAPLSDFALASFNYAVRGYRRRLTRGTADSGLEPGIDGDVCGYLQVDANEDNLDSLSAVLLDEDAPARVLSKAEAQELLGTSVNSGGIFYPDALWLNPPAVCRERLDHPLITLIEYCGDTQLTRTERGWVCQWGQRQRAEGDVAVLATALDVQTQSHLDWLPLQGIRGQTTHLPATGVDTSIATAVCHEGYFPPPRLGVHCMGASYGPNDLELDERPEEHQKNLEQLQNALPALRINIETEALRGHVALRCTTADYLPVVGAVPDRELFNITYEDLSRQKTRHIPAPAPLLEGLWIIAGLGSRGLTASPLAAEVVASAIMNEPPPIPRYLLQALSPARFLARGLIRGKPL